ncbi:hypothetical protein B0H11DRAFT_254841 [Mycena galericulata]|nr:hypothetical protein B0H11DRAFT_254841 [Mycena galericulata]
MIHDFLSFSTLVTSCPSFDPARFRYRCIRNILPLFPDKTFLFGEAGAHRLRFHIPTCLYSTHTHNAEETLDAVDFVQDCLLDLAECARQVNRGETLALVLIGHGRRKSNGEFQLCITAKGNRDGEAWITKRHLERALEKCRGKIVMYCNACHSGGLRNDSRWKLLAAAKPNELADALTTSASGNVRGTVFSLCTLAQVGREQGIVIPVPRSERRPPGTMVKLPPSPPPHSFSTTNRPVKLPSLERSTTDFLNGMFEHEQHLIYHSGNNFQMDGFLDGPWKTEIPLALSQAVVDQVITVPDDRSPNQETTVTRLNEIYHSTGSASSISDADVSHLACRRLHVLAPRFSTIRMSPHRDKTDAEMAARFIDDENSLTEGAILNLARALNTRHIQAVIVQLIARELNWTTSEVIPFLSLEEVKAGEFAIDEMFNNGVDLDDLVLRLTVEFNWMRSAPDLASKFWLAKTWNDIGRPQVSSEEWAIVVDAAVAHAQNFILA